MRKGPKCIQTLWDHPKKIPFVQKYKEIAMGPVRLKKILREKTPLQKHKEGAICAHSQIPRGSKRCCYLRNLSAGALKMLHRGPIIMQIPRGYQKKKFIV